METEETSGSTAARFKWRHQQRVKAVIKPSTPTHFPGPNQCETDLVAAGFETQPLGKDTHFGSIIFLHLTSFEAVLVYSVRHMVLTPLGLGNVSVKWRCLPHYLAKVSLVLGKLEKSETYVKLYSFLLCGCCQGDKTTAVCPAHNSLLSPWMLLDSLGCVSDAMI